MKQFILSMLAASSIFTTALFSSPIEEEANQWWQTWEALSQSAEGKEFILNLEVGYQNVLQNPELKGALLKECFDLDNYFYSFKRDAKIASIRVLSAFLQETAQKLLETVENHSELPIYEPVQQVAKALQAWAYQDGLLILCNSDLVHHYFTPYIEQEATLQKIEQLFQEYFIKMSMVMDVKCEDLDPHFIGLQSVENKKAFSAYRKMIVTQYLSHLKEAVQADPALQDLVKKMIEIAYLEKGPSHKASKYLDGLVEQRSDVLLEEKLFDPIELQVLDIWESFQEQVDQLS